MKKNLLLVVITIIFLTGCGNKVTCSLTTDGTEGLKTEVTAKLDKNDKVTEINMIYEFNNQETADLICSTFKQFEDKTNVKISCSGKKIKINGADDLNIAETDDTKKVIGKSKEAFIERAKDEGLSCK